MRRVLLAMLPLALACAKAETPATDSSASTAAMPTPLTEAQLAGTWTGTTKMDGDTTTVHWTEVCGGGTCRGTVQEVPGDTVVSTYRFDGDSAIGVSSPYVDKTAGNRRVIDNWVVRITGTSVSGHGWSVLADKPDSVVMRNTFSGSRQ